MKLRPVVQATIKLVPYIFYGLLLVFLFLYIKNIDFTKFQGVQFSWEFIIIASFFGLAMRFWQVFIWFVLLHHLGAKGLRHKTTQLVYVYAKSWLGRYIPGTAPWILGKIYFASKFGISKSKLAVSSLLEGALQVTVIMAVAFTILVFDPRLKDINTNIKLAMIVVLIACIVAIVPPIFNRIISIPYKLLRRKTIDQDDLASGSTIMQGVILYTVGAFLSGIALFFVAKAIYPELSYGNALYVMGVSNLAGAIGMLVIFAPSGAGVREGILITLLSIVMPPEFALIITVASRLWDIIMDGIFFLSSKLLQAYGQQR